MPPLAWQPMSYEVREIRRSELDAALDLARSVGSEVQAEQVQPALSVSASDEGQLLAVLLGVHGPGESHRMELCVNEQCKDDSEVGRALVNAALAKTRGHGIATSRLRILTTAGEPALWQSVYW